MAKLTVNTGTSANSRDGDSLRAAFTKINANFTELYDRAVNTDAQTLTLTGNTLEISGGNSVELNISPVGDLKGSVFADDSTLLVDGVNASIPYAVLSGAPTIPADIGDLTDTGSLLGGDTGDITFSATTISAPDNSTINIQALDSNSLLRSRLSLTPEFGAASIRGFSSEDNRTFEAAFDWDTATWVSNSGGGTILIVNALNIYNFIDTDLSNALNITLSINNGAAIPLDGWGFNFQTNTLSISTNVVPDPDPTTITELRLFYTFASRIGIDYDDGTVSMSARGDMNIELNSDLDIRLNARDDIRIEGADSFRLINSSSTAPIRIITDDNNASYSWQFEANGNFTFPDQTSQTTAYPGPQTSLDGDVTGSVFSDSSTLLVDGVNGKIVGEIETSTANITNLSSKPGSGLNIVGQFGDTNGYGILITGGRGLTGNGGSVSINGGPGDNANRGTVNIGQSSSDVLIDSGNTDTLFLSSNFGGLSIGRVGGITDIYGDVDFSVGRTIFQSGNAVTFNCPVNFTNAAVTGLDNLSSEGDINIRVNLTDSTTHTWRFGEDGNTDFPGTIDSPLVITQGIQSNDGTAEGDGNSLTVAAGSGSLSGGNLSLQAGAANSGTGGNIGIQAGTSQVGDGGNLNLLAGLAWNGSGGDVIISAGSAIISGGDGGDTYVYGGNGGTAGDGGDVQIIAGGSSSYNGGTMTISAGGGLLSGGDLTLLGGAGGTGIGGDLIIEGGQGFNDPGNVIIRGGISGGYRGDLTIEAGHVVIGSEGDINININLSDSTQRTWRFGEDGDLTFPDSTVQTTAFTTSPTLNVLKIDDGVHEKLQVKVDAAGVVEHDCSQGHIFYHVGPDANWTVNLTNLNLTFTYATTVTIIQTGGVYYPSAVQIGGVAQTILWQGGVAPTPVSNSHNIITFSIINVGIESVPEVYVVFGQMTSFNSVA